MVTRQQDAFLAQAVELRRKAFAVGLDVGAQFAVAMADGWRRHGVAGVRAACWDLAEMLADVPASWDVYARAREMARVEF